MHIHARSVKLLKRRGSRLSNQIPPKAAGVKRSQVQILSPRLVGSPKEIEAIGFVDVRQCLAMNPKTGKKKRGNPVPRFLSLQRHGRRMTASSLNTARRQGKVVERQRQ